MFWDKLGVYIYYSSNLRGMLNEIFKEIQRIKIQGNVQNQAHKCYEDT